MKKLFERCLGATYIHTENGGDYALEIDGNTLYLLFEWSDGAEDWINNFDFPAKPYKRMKDLWFCHRGFLRVWKAMRDDIEAQVKELLNNHSEITNITIIGYSHGGAMAVFATEDMMYLYGENYTVKGFGFGSPRVLWGYIPKAVRKRISAFETIRNIPDIVTHVPPMIFGYHNTGKLVKVGEKKKYSPIDAHRPQSYKNEL